MQSPYQSRRRFLLALTASTTLAACGGGMVFPVSEGAQRNLASRNVNVIQITTENIRLYNDATPLRINSVPTNPPADPQPYVYRLGPGDQLRIQSWSTPERTISVDNTEITQGPVINEAGEFFFPFLGMVRAQGLTVTQLRQNLERDLRAFLTDPQIEVEVARFSAHKVTIVGAVETPSSPTLTNIPTRLLDLVNAVEANENADLRQIVIRRGGNEHRVNLRAFMEQGTRGQNPILLPGDNVFVPFAADNRVFIFGEVTTREVTLGPPGRRTLIEILAGSGGIDRVRANARGVFIFRRQRGAADGIDVFQFNMRDASMLVLASEFHLAPMDVVFVTTDPITRWNDTVAKALSPATGFVQGQRIAERLTD